MGKFKEGLRNPEQAPLPDPLDPLEFELQRFMRHVHVGPYQELPQKWKDLKAELIARGEVMALPSLEIYGHHNDDPSKLETTILIGLQGPSPSEQAYVLRLVDLLATSDSPIDSACLFVHAAPSTPVDSIGAIDFPTANGLRPLCRDSTSTFPHSWFTCGLVTRRDQVHLRYGLHDCSPFTNKDFYYQAFAGQVTLNRRQL